MSDVAPGRSGQGGQREEREVSLREGLAGCGRLVNPTDTNQRDQI